MPKLRESPVQRMDRAFLAALKYGQTLRGDTNPDTLKIVAISKSAFYKKLKEPGKFSMAEARPLAQRYFTDRQLCEAFGVEYHGSTT